MDTPDALHDRMETMQRPGLLVAERVRLRVTHADAQRLAAIESQLAEQAGRRRVATLFALDAFEVDMLDLCLALQVDPALAALLAQASPATPPAATVRLACDLFGHAPDRIVGPGSPLVAWSLIEPVVALAAGTRGYAVDPAIAAALLGEPVIDVALSGFADATPSPVPPLPCWDAAAQAERIASRLEARQRVRFLIACTSQAAGRAAAALIADALGTRILGVALPGELMVMDRADLFMRAHRVALLAGYVPCWTSPPQPWPVNVRGCLLQFVLHPPGAAPAAVPGLTDLAWSLPELDAPSRRGLLAASVPIARSWPDGGDRSIAGNPSIRFDDIVALAAEAVETAEDAEQALRRRTLGRLGDAGTVLDCPFGWSDLVLPAQVEASLRQIPFEIRRRRDLVAAIAPQSRALYEGIAVSSLFCGPSGTGKTMAAQVIARDIGASLLRVDLASTISKYIGETAKNLRRIFDQAAGTNCIVMFDEADALFTRRTEVKDAHDRHANADTNYLLQLIESFDGAVLLATNKRDNIDPAFMRRIRHVVEFPAPDRPERERIWHTHLVNLGGAHLAEAAFAARLAGGVELSPAQIKNAVITAAYAPLARGAGPMTAEDILSGLDRELAKDGRALGVSQRRRINGDA